MKKYQTILENCGRGFGRF